AKRCYILLNNIPFLTPNNRKKQIITILTQDFLPHFPRKGSMLRCYFSAAAQKINGKMRRCSFVITISDSNRLLP
ncbi:MAG: hypothetical protein ACRC0C_08525, partial [Gibbsiella quercinecans]|uniref:hypothetical protein n=1 Tax=Gibbsiella quercinecans TaxID=929813 RepID=UPI003F2D8E0E